MWNFLQQIFALILLILTLPLWLVLFVLIPLSSEGPAIFKQLRWGKGKKPFPMYKFRTMPQNAEKLKKRYLQLNEADGPVFKIWNDPRYTNIGKFLAHSGLDELPQLLNILRGEMLFVGPRPLPVNEAKLIPNKYQERFSILPGITSLWIVKGAHDLSFGEWMRLDLEYVREKSFGLDLKIAYSTFLIILKGIKSVFENHKKNE